MNAVVAVTDAYQDRKLNTERHKIETELASCRDRLGIAKLDNDTEAFNEAAQRISVLELELQALEGARKEANRRAAAAAPASRARWYQGQLDELKKLEKLRLEAVGRAEKAARQAADALKEVIAIAARMEPVAISLGKSLELGITGQNFPTTEPAHSTRHSVRLCATLATIQPGSAYFGSLNISLWQHARDVATEEWVAGETKAMAGILTMFAARAPKA